MDLRTGTAMLIAAITLNAATAAAQENLVASTGGTGTVVHITTSSLSEFASESGIANIQLKDGQAGAIAIRGVAEGTIDIGDGPFVLPFLMSRGAGPYREFGAEKGAEMAANVQLLYPYTLGMFMLYAYDIEGIQSWSDLASKKVLNGPPAGAAPTNSRNLIQVFGGLKNGDDYESITVSWNQVPSTIVDGTVDAAVIPVQVPGNRLTRPAAAGAMTIVSMPKEIFETDAGQNLLNKPGSAALTLPVAEIEEALGDGWTIISEDDTFRAMSVVGGDFVNAAMDEDLAYQLTRTHIERIDDIIAKAPLMQYANLGNLDQIVSGVCGLNPVKYHPGAVRAWEESGRTIPDCAKP